MGVIGNYIYNYTYNYNYIYKFNILITAVQIIALKSDVF